MTSLMQEFEDLKRFRQIVRVLAKHGFGYFIEQLNLRRYMPFIKKLRPAKKQKTSLAVRSRKVLEELGPTFVKFGQILSITQHRLPVGFIHEFSKLQDEVPSLSYQTVKKEVEKELKKPLNKLFKSFNKKPVASASIGQVHKAMLKSGEKVAVKIQRPDIKKTIHEDIDLLHYFAKLIEKHVPESKHYHPVGLVEEFEKTIKKELDYTIEGRNIDKFYQNFKGDKKIKIPKVYWNFSTNHILTMEFIEGVKISELDKSKKHFDKKLIAKRGAEAFLKQILVYGFFHADPHPGNIFILKNNVIAFLDFGIMGKVDKEMKEKLSNLFIASIQRNSEQIVSELLEMGLTNGEIDEQEFKSDIDDIMDKYYDVSLKQVDLGNAINEVLTLAARYNIKIPKNFTLLGKALATIESIGTNLDPDFNMVKSSKPFVEELVKKETQPRYIMASFLENIPKLRSLLKRLPKRTDKILNKIEKGELKINIEDTDLKNFELEMDRSSNRLTLGVIVAAFVIASALIMQVRVGPLLFNFPVFAMIGFVIAGMLGIWLAVSILQSGRL